jgi:hypothetical protein
MYALGTQPILFKPTLYIQNINFEPDAPTGAYKLKITWINISHVTRFKMPMDFNLREAVLYMAVLQVMPITFVELLKQIELNKPKIIT